MESAGERPPQKRLKRRDSISLRQGQMVGDGSARGRLGLPIAREDSGGACCSCLWWRCAAAATVLAVLVLLLVVVLLLLLQLLLLQLQPPLALLLAAASAADRARRWQGPLRLRTLSPRWRRRRRG